MLKVLLTTLSFLFLFASENPFDLQKNRAKIEQEKSAYLKRLHIKSEFSDSFDVKMDEKNSTKISKDEQKLWQKIKADANSSKEITVFGH